MVWTNNYLNLERGILICNQLDKVKTNLTRRFLMDCANLMTFGLSDCQVSGKMCGSQNVSTLVCVTVTPALASPFL